MKTLSFIFGIGAIIFTTSVDAKNWDLARDFSATSNPNGAWTYGYYSLYGALGLDLQVDAIGFTKLTYSYSDINYLSWFTPNEISILDIRKNTNVNKLNLTAGLAPQIAFYAPVIRWTAPTDGIFHIKTDFSYLGVGASSFGVSQVGIRTDNVNLASSYIGGTDGFLNYENSISLLAGQYIDFFVAKNQHSIGLQSTITIVPEPNIFMLWIIGLAAFIKRHKTNRNFKL